MNDADRFDVLMSQILGKRLTYATLTAVVVTKRLFVNVAKQVKRLNAHVANDDNKPEVF